MPLTLHIATSNPGKLRDFEAGAHEWGEDVRLLPLPNLDRIPPPPEHGVTFEGIAVDKATAYSQHAPGLIVLADDSGLEVDALHGAPGVRSARFAEDAGFRAGANIPVDESNNLMLLERLRGIGPAGRTGRYVCALAAVLNGNSLRVARGTVEGRILEAPRGSGGFGYDPVFFIPPLGRTMAEISLEEKMRISHRGNALRTLLQLLIPNSAPHQSADGEIAI